MLAMRGKLYLFGGGAGEDWATTYNDINVYDPQTKVLFCPLSLSSSPLILFLFFCFFSSYSFFL